MVSVTSYNGKTITGILELTGLSSDEKPIESIDGYRIMNGSSFLEMDTGMVLLYDEENHTWNAM